MDISLSKQQVAKIDEALFRQSYLPKVKTSKGQRSMDRQCLEQFAINSARQQFVSESVQRAAKDVSLRS